MLVRTLGIALLALAATLSGCRSLTSEEAPPPTADRAEQLARQGDNAGAARVYEALAAEEGGSDRAQWQLRATRAWLAAHQPREAERVLGAVAGPLAPALQLDQQLLRAEVALASGAALQAWQQLSAMKEPAGAAAARYLELRERAALACGQFADAVHAEAAAEHLYGTPAERHSHRAQLLDGLRAAVQHGAQLPPAAASDHLVRGWWELAGLAAQNERNPGSATAALQAWELRYPTHPGAELVRSELTGHARPAPNAPHLALLLPLTGRQSAAASSIRDGFLTAYYVNPAQERPQLRIYDTGSAGVAETVTAATEAGAELIVGPLTREEVTAAAELKSPHPAMLALNFLPADHPVPQGFYQFALSPQEEARQVARRVLADGHRIGIALVPEGDWGNRVLTAFREELTAGGGTLLSALTFDGSGTNYGPAITEVLRIDDSNARYHRLESVLGTKLQFQPRRRTDISFIFAASPAPVERLLRPQLRFYFAGDVPTYATSDAFEPDPNANQDMDGIMFPDMPWMLGGGLADSVRLVTHAAWPNGGPRRNRLFAFGFDAYRLAQALRGVPAASPIAVEGLTGQLTLDPDRRVRRELEWAQLHDGIPRLLAPPAPAPSGTPAAATSGATPAGAATSAATAPAVPGR